ncbi:MAG: LysM peptidoglycan-binding domain-containing protein [Actinomycetota bacterium]|nr:LysM peptidoglycan-binding domain-containing protein [Actinomycetota bacterium]
MLSTTARTIGLTALSAGLVLGAAACADTETGETAPTINIRPESYQTRPPVTLAVESAAPATAGADGRTDQFQIYVFKEDEYPATIANRFDVSLDELLSYNDWTLEGQNVPQFTGAGQEVRIPPGARFIDPNATTTTLPPDPAETVTAGGGDNGGSSTSSSLNADRCAPGSYVLEENDYPATIAQKFDVSFQALLAVNNWTLEGQFVTNYPGVGETIVIPPAPDCPGQ